MDLYLLEMTSCLFGNIEMISKAYKVAIVVFLIGIALEFITSYFPMPALGSMIFQSLITVVAIHSGFSIAIIIYCVGRLDNIKREYIPRLDAVTKEWIRYYDSGRIESNSHEAKETRKGVGSAVYNRLEDFKDMHKGLRGLTKGVYLSFSISLLWCFLGLFYSVYKPQMNLWIFLIWSVLSLFYTLFSIYDTWNKVSDFSEKLENDYLSNRR
jgi:hypothetical protein